MLLEQIRISRDKQGLTRSDIAARTGFDIQTVKRLERGIGSVANLITLMAALDLHLAGVALGKNLPDQLKSNRIRRKLSISEVAKRAQVSPATVRSVEACEGSIASLLKILSVLADNARPRQPAARAFWQLDPMSDRDVRFTPPEFYQIVCEIFGVPDLDPCGHSQSPVQARRMIMLSNGGDGLADDWSGSFVYMNPPFSALLKWLRRAEDQWRLGNVQKVVALVPARLDAPWYHDHLRHFADVWILRGRLSFLTLAGKGNQAPFALMVVFIGVPEDEIDKFTRKVPGSWFAPRIARIDHWLKSLSKAD